VRQKGFTTKPIAIILFIIVGLGIIGSYWLFQYLGLSISIKDIKNCNLIERPMTDGERLLCFCPLGNKKFQGKMGAFCATNSRKFCRADADCSSGEKCISKDSKKWFCTGGWAGCHYVDPEDPKEICVD